MNLNRIRNFILLSGWFVFMVFAIYFNTAAPSPIKVQELTETQINEQVRIEGRAKAIGRATAAARKVFRAQHCDGRYSGITGRAAYEFGLSPRLLAAVIFVESGCRAKVVSGRNSIGLMQVNPAIWGHRKDLTDPEKNVKMGALILKGYINRYGLVEGLHHYNGYSEVHGHEYVNKILTIAQGG